MAVGDIGDGVVWAPVMQWYYSGATYFCITTREEPDGQIALGSVGRLGRLRGWPEGHSFTRLNNTLKVFCWQLLSGMAMKCNLFLQDISVIESFADAVEMKLSTFLGELL